MGGRRLAKHRRRSKPLARTAPMPAAETSSLPPVAPPRTFLHYTLLEWGVLVFLLVLVWGSGALDRGTFQDDTTYLQQMKNREHHGPASWFVALGAHRPLSVLPAWLAVRSPSPPLMLQLLHGSFWLLQALLVGALARRFFSGWNAAPFVAAAVTLCASSDFLTNSPVAIHYNQAATALLVALVLGVDFARAGGWWRLVVSALALQISLWTVDVAFPVVLALPAWIWIYRAKNLRWRAATWTMVCWVTTIPFAVNLIERLKNDSYARRAVDQLGWETWLERGWNHFVVNFAPWRWALDRPSWGVPIDTPLATSWLLFGGAVAALATVGALVVAGRQGRDGQSDGADGTGAVSLPWVSAALLAATIASHAAYSRLHFHHIWYRTHIVSRLWCSLLVILITVALARHLGRHKWLALTLPATFVFFGAAGSLERQDFYSSSWRSHQQELTSLVRQAPAISRDATLLLRADPPKGRYLATEVTYLSQAWGHLLWGWPAKTVLVSPERLTSCVPDQAVVACTREICGDPKGCPPFRLDPAQLVMFEYDSARNEWLLAESLPPDLAPADPDGSAYRPRHHISGTTPTERQRAFLMLD